VLTHNENKTCVAVLGAIPPPWGGQAVMTQLLLDGHYKSVNLRPVTMRFSRTTADRGNLSFYKIAELFRVILAVYWARICGSTILYYAPAGPERGPLLRDALVLASTRWMFRKTIWHFHAGGFHEYQAPSVVERKLLSIAFDRPTLAIRLGQNSPPDDVAVKARMACIVANGVPDPTHEYIPPRNSEPARLLFIGVLNEGKGVGIIIDALVLLREHGQTVCVDFVGEWASKSYRLEIEQRILEHELKGIVFFHGTRTGVDKDRLLREAAIYCFPSHFRHENLPVTVIEAMAYSLPVVASDWRGIPDLVVDNVTGVIVPPCDAMATAEAISRLLSDPDECRRMGAAARERYVAQFTAEMFHRRMGEVFTSVLRAEL
jgi:glycosyltransferase involved in cell wall biosynthesis